MNENFTKLDKSKIAEASKTSKLFSNISTFSSLLKTIPNSIQALFSIHIIEASKRLLHIEDSLKEAFSYVSSTDNYIFIYLLEY